MKTIEKYRLASITEEFLSKLVDDFTIMEHELFTTFDSEDAKFIKTYIMIENILEDSRSYAKGRRINNHFLKDFSVVQEKITHTEMMLQFYKSGLISGLDRIALEYFVKSCLLPSLENLMVIYGAKGYCNNYPPTQLWLEVRKLFYFC